MLHAFRHEGALLLKRGRPFEDLLGISYVEHFSKALGFRARYFPAEIGEPIVAAAPVVQLGCWALVLFHDHVGDDKPALHGV